MAAGGGAFGQKKPAAPGLPPPPVFATALLETLSAAQGGFGRFAARRISLGSFRYERSLVTEVSDDRPEGRVSSLTLLLAGKYNSFSATVGRDENEARGGTGAVVFEVWGDNKPLYQGQPMVALRNRPQIGGGLSGRVLRSPQELTISVAGVRVLRLVTRYADEIPQGGGVANRAKGCVWADARLTPGKIGKPDDPARDALRTAALQLGGRLIAFNAAGDSAGEAGRPLRIAVAPLIPASSRGESQGGEFAASAEPSLRIALRDFLARTRRGGEPAFAAVNRRDEEKLTVPGALRGGGRDRALTDAASKIGADVVITGYFDWTDENPVALYALNVRDGRKISVE